ncbi:hypothetical protein [Cryobacterium sp. Y57]|uniref:hypothetical protein n=1 Tax=Cryobacterium sp. Y57 TaxID=2048287 RepID=UPI000CE36533|nr:hypothetical protein [Cryobacterium sp. Y57]
MARIRSTALVLSVVSLFLWGVTGCASQSTDAHVSPAAAFGVTLTEWSSITDTIAGSIRPTFDAFEGTWDVPRAAPPESACWTESEDVSGTPHWEKRSDGYEVAFSAKNSWFDRDEDPWTAAECYARVWTSTFPTTSFDPDYDSFTYGAQLAGLVDSDQLRVTGGFDGDNWMYLAEVSCDTPGSRALVQGGSIEPFAHP